MVLELCDVPFHGGPDLALHTDLSTSTARNFLKDTKLHRLKRTAKYYKLLKYKQQYKTYWHAKRKPYKTHCDKCLTCQRHQGQMQKTTVLLNYTVMVNLLFAGHVDEKSSEQPDSGIPVCRFLMQPRHIRVHLVA